MLAMLLIYKPSSELPSGAKPPLEAASANTKCVGAGLPANRGDSKTSPIVPLAAPGGGLASASQASLLLPGLLRDSAASKTERPLL